MKELLSSETAQVSGGNQIELCEVVLGPGQRTRYVNENSGNEYIFVYDGFVFGPDGVINPYEYHTHMEDGKKVIIIPASLLS